MAPTKEPSKDDAEDPMDLDHADGVEDDDAAPRPDTASAVTSKPRKGAARPSTSLPQQTTPGDPRYPRTFINIESNEQRVGAYLGFNDVKHIRILLVTWPVLTAVGSFEGIAAHLSKNKAFTLLYDAESIFTDVRNPWKQWPPDDRDSRQQIQNKRARYLACILIRMEKDLRHMMAIDASQNQPLQRQCVVGFRARFPNVAIPPVAFAASTADRALPIVRSPTLGPYADEHRLEVLNRCWNLLRYYRYCRQSPDEVWKARFSAEGLRASILINQAHVPAWMCKVEDTAPVAIAKTTDVVAADALPPRTFQVLWDTSQDFEGKDDLDEALSRAKAQNIHVPSSLQDLSIDPRLLDTAAAFKDSIRRQYNCQLLLINIRSLDLKYRDARHPSRHPLSKDALRDAWWETKRAFEDAAHSEFMLHVVFEALDDPGLSVYESFEPPPALSAYFNTESGDVCGHGSALSATAATAFGLAAITDTPTAEADRQDPSTNGAEALPTFLDLVFSQSASVGDIGESPDPRKKFLKPRDHARLMLYYDGFDVTIPEERRQWQRARLEELTMNAAAANVKVDKLPKSLTKEQLAAVQEANEMGQRMAVAMEDDGPGDLAEQEDRYYAQHSAFSGTQAQAGPPLDLCLQLLDCHVLGNGLVHSELLEKVTTRDFYPYQVSGAVGLHLKLYGRIDAGKLLRATSQTGHPRAAQIKEAASRLEDLLMHGAIMADDVGFGKTIMLLLAAFLHSVSTDEVEAGRILHRPILLVTPPALISQWVKEIRHEWPFFQAVISYEDHEFRETMALSSLSHSAMVELPSMETMPTELQFLWETSNPAAGKAIVVTSYETHKSRTGIRRTKTIPGVPHRTPRFHANGEPIWKRPPKTTTYWTSNHEGRYALLIADEAQKIKNYSSGLWNVLYCHSMRKTLLATATPIFNSIKDLLAMLALLWPMAQRIYDRHLQTDAQAARWVAKAGEDRDDLMEKIDRLDRMDPLRLAALKPKALAGLISPKRKNIHTLVSRGFKPTLELSMIRRSAASELPMASGPPISLRDIFKKKLRKTAIVPRRLDEELEYQLFHRQAAQEYVRGIAPVDRPLPSKPAAVHVPAAPFRMPVQPMRRLAMANFATKLARLNAIMEHTKGNTHVPMLNSWRGKGYEAEFIHDLTRGRGEAKAKTAADLLNFLVDGSPIARLVFQIILQMRGLEKLDKAKYGHHQKLLIGEATPANAWFLQAVLRAALIDARLMHAGLTNRAKSDLVDVFNDPHSSVRVLIMMTDVGAQGLNLHKACNWCIITSVARGYAVEEQVGGRALRVNSEFVLHMVRRETPNSYDQVLSARQADKATVQLASNAHDPRIQGLIVSLLNENQPAVDACHESAVGQELKAELAEKKKVQRIARAMAEKEAGKARVEKDNVRNAAKEHQALQAEPVSGQRPRRRPVRFDPSGYDDDGNARRGGPPAEEGEGRSASEEEADDKFDLDFVASTDVDADPDGTGSEGEGGGPTPDRRKFVGQQRRDDALEHDEDFLMFSNSEQLAEFVSENQPDDETRHRLALIQLPYRKHWTEADLATEFNLRIGLLLLYNHIQGRRQLSLGKSVHIRYLAFPEHIIKSLNAATKITKTKIKAAEKAMDG